MGGCVTASLKAGYVRDDTKLRRFNFGRLACCARQNHNTINYGPNIDTDMKTNKSINLTWQDGDVSRRDRERLINQKGCTIWFSGLSGSGKSTVAIALEQERLERGKLCYRLDGDNIRLGINKNLGFSDEDRTENIRRAGEVSKLFSDAGVIVLSSFISPFKLEGRSGHK